MVPADAVRRLGASPLLRGNLPPVSKKLHTVYFDTPGFKLWRRGIALRLRRDGGRWLQSVKGGGSVAAGLHRRTETEAEVAGPFPDFARIEDGGLAGVFASPRLRAQLAPVFVTEFRRSARRLEPEPDAAVEAAIDVGAIRSGERAEPLCELELELRQGSPSQLYALALKLLERFPLSIENRSKAERGYALARGARPRPVKARPAGLSGAMPAREAFQAVIRASLAHLQANERGMLGGKDPEYLHQMRVALRRLRSAFSLFAPLLPEAEIAPHRAGLKWLAAMLGPARDWDVFMTETLPPIRAEFAAHAGLAEFAGDCARRRRWANRKARRAVGSARYQRLLLSLGGWIAAADWYERGDPMARADLAAPVRGFAREVLDARYRGVRRRSRKFQELSQAQLHRLRIAVKKYRYATDFFAGLFGGAEADEALKRLARLQDILGAINDAATVAALVREGDGKTSSRRARDARAILLGWSRGRIHALRRELATAWKAFRCAERFW